jgi:hypothetical protein
VAPALRCSQQTLTGKGEGVGKAERTIVDILKKGNQEQFHSAMIAWLLDTGGDWLGLGYLRKTASEEKRN